MQSHSLMFMQNILGVGIGRRDNTPHLEVVLTFISASNSLETESISALRL